MSEEERFQILDNQEVNKVIVERVKELVKLAEEFDTLVFLDKSARPISTAFTTYWRKINPDKPMPNIKFINIGREKLQEITYQLRSELGHNYTRDDLEIALERFNFSKFYGEDNMRYLQEVVGESQRLLIVDDLRNTGNSLSLAHLLIQRVKPDIVCGEFSLVNYEDYSPEITSEFERSWYGLAGVQDDLDPAYSEDPRQRNIAIRRSFRASPVRKENELARRAAKKLREELRYLMQGA